MENLSLHDLSEGLLVKHKNNNKKNGRRKGRSRTDLHSFAGVEGQKVNNELTMQKKNMMIKLSYNCCLLTLKPCVVP